MDNGLTSALYNAGHLLKASAIKLSIPSQKLEEISLVVPHICISNQGTAANIPKLKKYNIVKVISVNDYPLTPEHLQLYAANGIQYSNYPLQDVVQQPLAPLANLIHAELEPFVRNTKSKGRVLINCQMGISRSVSIVLWHLICTYKWSYEKALKCIRKYRPFACPNLGFETQLKHLASQQQHKQRKKS